MNNNENTTQAHTVVVKMVGYRVVMPDTEVADFLARNSDDEVRDIDCSVTCFCEGK